MDRPPLKRRDYVEDQETAVAQRFQQVAAQVTDITLLSLLAEQMDVPSLVALNTQYPEVVGQATILSMLSRRFDLPRVVSFEDFVAALAAKELQKEASRRNLPLDVLRSLSEERRQELQEEEDNPITAFFRSRAPYDTEAEIRKLEDVISSSDSTRDIARKANMTIRGLIDNGYVTEALLVFEKYYYVFDTPVGKDVLSNERASTIKTPRELFSATGMPTLNMLEEAALRTEDPIFYQETLEIVNEKLALLGYDSLMLPDRLKEMKEYAVSLKNAFYDNNLEAYNKAMWKIILEGYLRLLLVFYPVLLPLSLLSGPEIWTKFVSAVRKLVPDHRLDYRVLSPKIRAGVERSIALARQEGLVDALAKLKELGFQLA